MSSTAGRASRPDRGGIPAPWIKSSYSGPTGGNCVEVAFLAAGQVALRNSRDPDGTALLFSRAEWDAFVSGVRAGEFGLPG